MNRIDLLTDLDQRVYDMLTHLQGWGAEPVPLAALLRAMEPATRRWPITKAGVTLRLERLAGLGLVECVGDGWRRV